MSDRVHFVSGSVELVSESCQKVLPSCSIYEHDLFSVNWKPTCFARGQSMKGLPGYSSGCILLLVVPAIKRKENIHEPIQEVITCVVALPVSFGMGTEVSVPDSARRGWS